jgi:hypothetical protein
LRVRRRLDAHDAVAAAAVDGQLAPSEKTLALGIG